MGDERLSEATPSICGLWIYGAIPPEPAGGVSTFVERLVHTKSINVEGVIDPYFGKKNKVPVRHVIAKSSRLKDRLIVLLRLLTLRNRPLLINASHPRAIIYLYPFLFGRKCETFLILHHGNLRIKGILEWIFRKAIDQYSFVGCLSEDQRNFYISKNVIDHKLILVNNYIPPIKQESIIFSDILDQVVKWLNKGQGSIVISSGYAQEFYHHDWLLDALNDSSDFEDIRYIVCCYGPTTPFLDTLRAKASSLKQALVVYGLNPAEFDHVLGLAAVYVRASDVDSFGIAAWDAAAKGVAVVASNICERPPEAFVHPKGNRRAFLASLRAALASYPRQQNEIKGVKNRVNIESFLNLKDFNETEK